MISRRTALAGVLVGGTGLAAAAAFARWGPWRGVFGPDPKPLAIPDSMTGEVRDGVRTYDLVLRQGLSRFFDGVDTPTLGINGPYLGPTLRMRAGETVQMNVTNRIGESSTLSTGIQASL